MEKFKPLFCNYRGHKNRQIAVKCIMQKDCTHTSNDLQYITGAIPLFMVFILQTFSNV